MLSRLGPWCHDRRRFVLGLWIALLVLGNAVAGGVGDAYRQDFSLDGFESTDGFSLVQEAFPDGSGTPQTAQIVFRVDQEVDVAGGLGGPIRTRRTAPRERSSRSGSSEGRANATDAHPGRRQVAGGMSSAYARSAGGPDWGPLERTIAGGVAVAGSPAFDRLPRPFNARYHDPLPRAVVLCAAPADVVATLAFLAAHGLEPAIRSGGHCFAGHSSTSGVVIDVSAMRAVSIDGDLATVGAGARLGAVYDTLAAGGRTIPGGSCPAVGIAGLTLGGGLGILGRSYGVTSDRLVAAEVVLADGRVVVCDEHHESDLFWALRGAGAGNFGVVTSLVFRTVPEPDVTNVHLSWPFSDAAAVIGGWQAWAPFGPDELAASLKVTAAAEVDRPPAVDVYAAVRGSEGDPATLADQLAARVGRDPTAVAHRRMSFAETRRFWAQLGAVDLASAIPEPDDVTVPRHLVARTEFFRRPLPTDALAALVAHLAAGRTTGEERELDFMPWGGAYNRVPPDATAFVHREEHFQLKHAALLDPEAPATVKAAAHRWVGRSWSTVHPWGSGRAFQNFADPDLENWAEAYYGTNYPRLVRVKAEYDPGNVFHADQSLPV